MTEFELIERIFATLQHDTPNAHDIEKGIGDDAAITRVPAGARLVSCIDTLVQGRHFAADWDSVEALAFAIGYKSVAVNVSDIAAMGASAHSILLALALPQRLANTAWLETFAKGLFHACQQFGVILIGGDTTRHDQLVISISAQGFVNAPATPVYRSGAQAGDTLYVSGTLGDASYALQHPDTKVGQKLAHRLHTPTPRAALGNALGQLPASAMIDISDGLYQDLKHICSASHVYLRIDVEHLPVSSALSEIAFAERLTHQLTGGDDYELTFTLAPSLSPPDTVTPVHAIGQVLSTEALAALPFVPETPQPILFYQGQPITSERPAPFTTLPTLDGYQHFTG